MTQGQTTQQNTQIASSHAAGADFPPVIGVDLLSLLLDKTPQTIFADRSRAPGKVPPACVLPGCKSPRWITADVIDWMRKHQEKPGGQAKPAGARRVGRPTKAEQIRRKAAEEAVQQQEGGAE